MGPETSCHPPFGPKHALEERRHIEVGIERGEVQAEAWRVNLNLAQVYRRSGLQSLDLMCGK